MTAQATQNITNAQYKTDLLTTYQKLKLWAGLPRVKSVFYFACVCIGLFLPILFIFLWPAILWVACSKHTFEFPGRMPQELKRKDPTDPAPGGKGFRLARGAVYLGNHRYTWKEVWLAWSDMLTHLYMLAATGGGKSEALWAIYANFLCAGSGFTLGDGKGTLQFIRAGRILCRRFGVEDEFFTINYMSPSKNPDAVHKRMSHRINPYSEGTAAQIKEAFASIALTGDAGQNQYFEDNAATVIERAFPAMVELRDKGIITLDIQTIGSFLPLHKLYELSHNENVSRQSQQHILDYLDNIGFNFDTPDKQGEEIKKMHGQFISHFNKAVASLSVQYRDIYVVDQGDVNMRDITDNRRILIFTLPSLEKSGAELKNLGKILLTAQRNAVSTGLGDQLEGTREESISNLPSSHRVPYGLGFDEWAFYSIPDMALLPAQIRGLYFSAGYFAQDYAGTERAGEMDAEQIFSNTRVKCFGALEEAGKSWQRIREMVGEIKTAVNSRYNYVPGILGGRQIIDREHTEITHRSPIEIQDLQKQVEGQFYMLMRGRLSPISFYHTALDEQEKQITRQGGGAHAFKLIRLNKTYRPTDEQLRQIEQREAFMEIMFSSNKLYTGLGSLSELKRSIHIASQNNSTLNTNDFISSLVHFVDKSALQLGLTTNFRSASVTPRAPATTQVRRTNGDDTGTDASGSSDNSAADTADLGLTNDAERSPSPLRPQASSGEASIMPTTTDNEFFGKANQKIGKADDPGVIAKPQLVTNISKADSIPEISPSATNADDSLLEQTIAAKEKIENSTSGPITGAQILSSRQQREIMEDISTINKLLGLTEDESRVAASATIEAIARRSYYLAPPQPEQIQESDVNKIRKRVEQLLQ